MSERINMVGDVCRSGLCDENIKGSESTKWGHSLEAFNALKKLGLRVYSLAVAFIGFFLTVASLDSVTGCRDCAGISLPLRRGTLPGYEFVFSFSI